MSVERFDAKIKKAGQRIADAVSSFLGTWKFIFCYTVVMFGWILLHELKLLNFDSPDFTGFSLLLAYFSGIQASILLISEERQARIDRKRAEQTLNMTKKSIAQIDDLTEHIGMIEEIVEDMYKEISEEKSKSE